MLGCNWAPGPHPARERPSSMAGTDPLLLQCGPLSLCWGVLVTCPQYHPSYGIPSAMCSAYLSLSLAGHVCTHFQPSNNLRLAPPPCGLSQSFWGGRRNLWLLPPAIGSKFPFLRRLLSPGISSLFCFGRAGGLSVSLHCRGGWVPALTPGNQQFSYSVLLSRGR